ncbi:MAG: hypothetical protein NT136_01325 [Candidatus Moranbacteria bacterium]|nr:hypothetical protein [Candidatus Moranbacteria bacterium]
MIIEEEKTKERTSLKAKIRHFFAQDFFRNAIVHWALIGAFFLNIANWGLLAFFIRPVDFPIILHYNVYFGVDLIGDWWQAYFLPLMGAAIMAVNITLAHFFYRKKERIASYLLLLAAFFVQVGTLIASASVVLINY